MNITASELKAVDIALDELRSYHEAIGNIDDCEYKEYEKHGWTIRKLEELLKRAGIKHA